MPMYYIYIWDDVIMIVIVITLQCNHNRNRLLNKNVSLS